ncbi:MAG: type II toxin-antitoxin system VapC family toxin [Clostridiales Family XIII bacterium]|jgi:PIN domain nuclease of toxin-antitoxin system|nr:type II toxin-antitoxin system VapC family toxin [Clostridiales Family XIII bacterium]
MRYLIDTHVLICALTDSRKLTKDVRALLTDRSNDILVSMASILEIAIKMSVGKLELRGGISVRDIENAASDIGFEMIDIGSGDCSALVSLPFARGHKDPFDRLLVSQAIERGITLVSIDRRLVCYATHGLRLYGR